MALRLPAELLYPICASVISRRDLVTLAATSRFLQRPAESVLHRKIVLESGDHGRRFIKLLDDYPRFAPLIRELRLEWCSEPEKTGCREYWERLHGVLGGLTGLESLIIDDGRDMPFSWILSALSDNRLKVLRCPFVLDVQLLQALRRQVSLEDLSWTGALVSMPAPTPIIDPHSNLNSPQLSIAAETGINPDLDLPLISVIRQHIPQTDLPRLKYLHSESLALARALVPGRPVTHIWVPGASFAAAVSSDYVYRHISCPPLDHMGPSSSTQDQSSSDSGPAEVLRLAEPRTDMTNTQRTERLSRAIQDFGLSIGPVLSFRLSLDLPQSDVIGVLACIAQNLPELRALGFVPTSILDPPSDEGKTKLFEDESPIPRMPHFAHLHTICLWSIPSRRAVSSLEGSSELPALRTLACLHFSPAFEWLCLPINDDKSDSTHTHRGGIDWKHEMEFDGGGGGGGNEGGDGDGRRRRRLTAVHDPENLLWRDV